MRNVIFKLAAFLIGLAIVLVVLEVVFRILPTSDSLKYLPVNSQNPVIRFEGDRDIVFSKNWNFSIIVRKHVNSAGFLSDTEYVRQPESDLLTIIGDSYVEARQVENAHAMHGLLSDQATGMGRVYGLGSSGSPLSSYLAYAKYAVERFGADKLVFIVVGNDFDESLAKYKRVPGRYYFVDNGEGGLDLVRVDYRPSASARVFRESALIRYLMLNLELKGRLRGLFRGASGDAYVGNTRADFDEVRLTDSRRAVDEFFRRLPDVTGLSQDKILFVLDGMRPELYEPPVLEAACGSFFGLMRAYFLDAARERNYEIIDMQSIFVRDFERRGARFEFPTDDHWNAQGHLLVAQAIAASGVFEQFLREPGLASQPE